MLYIRDVAFPLAETVANEVHHHRLSSTMPNSHLSTDFSVGCSVLAVQQLSCP